MVLQMDGGGGAGFNCPGGLTYINDNYTMSLTLTIASSESKISGAGCTDI